MKSNSFKSILAAIISLFSITLIAQPSSYTIIQVEDDNYNDQVWVFTAEGTCNGFDNGWDGYKFLAKNVVYPQIYYASEDGTFQVSTTNDVNKSVIGFIPGINACKYKLTFTHEDLDVDYDNLYLIDNVTGEIVDITQSGSTYNFSCCNTDPANRFSLATSIPVDEEDSTEFATTDAIVNETVEDTLATDKSNTIGDSQITTQLSENKAENVKIFTRGHYISIQNNNAADGQAIVYSLSSGQEVKRVALSPFECINIQNNQQGAYIVRTSVEKFSTSTKVLVR